MAREREDYDDEDDRPSRRRDRDDDDDRDVELSSMDVTFNNNFVILLIVTFCCCAPVGIIYGILGLTQCKDPSNKTKAIILLVVGSLGIVLNIIATVANSANR